MERPVLCMYGFQHERVFRRLMAENKLRNTSGGTHPKMVMGEPPVTDPIGSLTRTTCTAGRRRSRTAFSVK
jgi:hypothetical protein